MIGWSLGSQVLDLKSWISSLGSEEGGTSFIDRSQSEVQQHWAQQCRIYKYNNHALGKPGRNIRNLLAARKSWFAFKLTMTFAPSLSIQKCHTSKQKSWTNDDSLPCNDGVACTRNDHCSNGRCIGTPFSCLSCEECYNDACRIKPGHCIIIVAGVRTCFAHGELRPGYPCQVIVVSVNYHIY